MSEGQSKILKKRERREIDSTYLWEKWQSHFVNGHVASKIMVAIYTNSIKGVRALNTKNNQIIICTLTSSYIPGSVLRPCMYYANQTRGHSSGQKTHGTLSLMKLIF